MIIGLTGTKASGKGEVAEFFKQKRFVYSSLSDIVRKEAMNRNLINYTVKDLQDIGNELRTKYGNGILAVRAMQRIEAGKNYVIDGIRNLGEVDNFQTLSTEKFYLIAVDAPQEIRFQRLTQRARPSDPKTLGEFFIVDDRDRGKDELDSGQQVDKCMEKADFKIYNNKHHFDLYRASEEIFRKVYRPSWDEYFLNMAREASSRSKDPSTKVGAVIVRPDKSVCAVGYNGFPQKMPDNDRWYLNREEKYSRTIHAEINAHLFSRDQSHEGYTLYTYPFLTCDRCFVEMVQTGIKKFVAPIPTEDALSRWKASFDKVKQYAKECGVEVVEIDFFL